LQFPGDDIPIIRGSALCALKGEKKELGEDAIMKLMDTVRSHPCPNLAATSKADPRRQQDWILRCLQGG
jgi:translation elongation factor EF-Tu-like GTPase